MKNHEYVTPRRPFPQAGTPENKSYKISPLMPSGVSQDEMNKAVIKQFKGLIDNGDLMIDPATASSDDFRMVMNHNTGGGAADMQVTTSESMGYGMLMLVILAGQDEALGIDVKAYFDGMFRSLMHWRSRLKIKGERSHLMLWQLVQPGGAGTPFKADYEGTENENVENGDCATDGDLDMAYALLLADKQWGSDGRYNYHEYALAMINDLWETCVDIDSQTHEERGVLPNYHIKVGDWADTKPLWAKDYGLRWDITRPSDFITGHFKAFKEADEKHDWQKVIDETYACIKQLCSMQNPPTGLLPDFAHFDRETKTWKPVPATEDEHWESPNDCDYNANACRTPWRLGTDYFFSGSTPIDDICLKPLNSFLKKVSGGDFENIAGYTLGGTPNDEYAPYFSNPALVTAAAFGDQEWLDAGWNYAKELEWVDDQYGSYINVLALMVASGNFWFPG